MNDNSRPDTGSARDEARRWVLRFNADIPPNDQDIEALGQWIKQDPTHLEELKRAEALWDETSSMAPRLLVSMDANSQKLLKSAGNRTRDNQRKSQESAFLSHARAAVILPILALCGLLLWQMFFQGGNNNGHYSTGTGQVVALTLDDQSIIHLDSNTNIEVDYDQNQRTISLNQGRAYFEVAKDKSRPFVVSTASGFVRAVGTAFSVSLEERAVKVAVTEGIVDIGRNGSDVMDTEEKLSSPLVTRLNAGSTAVFDKATETISNQPIAEIRDSQSWKDGYLIFKGQTLESVLAEILRYTDTEIHIEDDALKSLSIGGRFKTGEVAPLLETLELSFGIKASRLSPNRIRLEAGDDESS